LKKDQVILHLLNLKPSGVVEGVDRDSKCGCDDAHTNVNFQSIFITGFEEGKMFILFLSS